MAEKPPKTYAELQVENEALRAEVGRLDRSLSSMQAGMVARDGEIYRLHHPKKSPRALDKTAKDKFQRPAFRR